MMQPPQDPFTPAPYQKPKTPTWLLVLMWIGISLGILAVLTVLGAVLVFGLIAFACSK